MSNCPILKSLEVYFKLRLTCLLLGIILFSFSMSGCSNMQLSKSTVSTLVCIDSEDLYNIADLQYKLMRCRSLHLLNRSIKPFMQSCDVFLPSYVNFLKISSFLHAYKVIMNLSMSNYLSLLDTAFIEIFLSLNLFGSSKRRQMNSRWNPR